MAAKVIRNKGRGYQQILFLKKKQKQSAFFKLYSIIKNTERHTADKLGWFSNLD